MKTIYKSLALFVTAVGFSSCVNSWLDLDPSNGIPTNTAITNYNDAKNAMYGVYDGLQGNSTYTEYYAARMFYYGDVRGDDMQARTQGMRTSSCYEMRYTLDDAPSIWNVPYNVIRRANRIIEAIDNKQITDYEANKAALDDIYAQAKVIRALVHFDLVKIYGMPYTADEGASLGVPVVTSALDPVNGEYQGRKKVSEVYTQVVEDLTDATTSKALTVSKKTGEKQGYIDQWVAEALLCRVYLYMGKNTEALDVAENIINNSPYKLWTQEQYVQAWDKADPNHTSEMIFELLNNGTDDWADREGIGYLYHEDGYADAICTKSFVDMLSSDKGDVRINIILPVQTTHNPDGSESDLYQIYKDARIFINKFPMGAAGDMRLANLPMLRLSEVYLNAAEAAIKKGDKPNAVKYLNELIENRTSTASQLVNEGNVTLERVLQERRKELVGEGQRFFDALRNNETIVRYTDESNKGWHYSLDPESQKFDRTYFRALLPIPVSETNVNPILKSQQNPGY